MRSPREVSAAIRVRAVFAVGYRVVPVSSTMSPWKVTA